MLEPGDNDAGRTPGQHFEQDLLFLLRQIVGHAHNRLQRGLFQRFGNAREHLWKHHIAERRNNDGNKVDPL